MWVVSLLPTTALLPTKGPIPQAAAQQGQRGDMCVCGFGKAPGERWGQILETFRRQTLQDLVVEMEPE